MMAQGLLTDAYELAMLEVYHAHGMNETASFELFFRTLPPERGFLLAAGLEQALAYLESLQFNDGELAWLSESGLFSSEFLETLATLRFTGDVDAMPEGTVFFANEPVLRITAPLPQAQLVETRLLNLVHFQTLIASKAARIVLAAPGKKLVDFGLRRAHGAEAGVLAARAAYLAGFSATATLQAARQFGIPASGTMAHSFVQAHDSEAAAFEHFTRVHKRPATLLIDTYDTEHAASIAAQLAPKLEAAGLHINAVRLDSGDLAAHARAVRAILDEADLQHIGIFASGGLDELMLQSYCRDGVPIDGFGIGTNLTTSSDVPALDCAYKLQAYAGRARRKRSEGKATWPGCKHVYRHYTEAGRIAHDIVALREEEIAGEPLLRPAMRGGKRVPGLPSLAQSRARAAAALAQLPEPLRQLGRACVRVDISPGIRSLAAALDAEGAPCKPS